MLLQNEILNSAENFVYIFCIDSCSEMMVKHLLVIAPNRCKHVQDKGLDLGQIKWVLLKVKYAFNLMHSIKQFKNLITNLIFWEIVNYI